MSDSNGDGLTGPDLVAEGLAAADLPPGGIAGGHAYGEQALIVRKGGELCAMAATCSHYGGPLAEGLFDGELVRCPWHHACFDPATGDAVKGPALNPVTAFTVAERGGRLYVSGKRETAPAPAPIPAPPSSVVIVGGGAAGNAAAETLRKEGYQGPVTIISADPELPYDRPNLSKDYLAGNAPEDWIPLHDEAFYRERNIELLLGRAVNAVDTAAHSLTLEGGERREYGALLLATGADPIRLDTPGMELPHVRVLRSLADSRAIIAAAGSARSAVVVGASFIGLEAAAALVTRGLEVHVVAPEARPMERILGPDMGDFVRALHEEHGVHFHLGHTLQRVEAGRCIVDDGSTIDAQLVVVGVGVRPSLSLAQQAGLTIDRGVVVNEYLHTSAPDVFAAGDIARWPDRHTHAQVRVEHWVVAERHGRVAARNILGRREPFTDVPFFWSQHYDISINYVGHAEGWDRIDINGSISDHDAVLAYRKAGKTLALASIWRDMESLQAELAMERGDSAALEAIVAAG